MSRIMLDWEDECASVIEEKDGCYFEIGTVLLKTLALAIVGGTYYHHMWAIADIKFSEARRRQFNRLQTEVEAVQQAHPEHPEFSAKNLRLDTPKHPHFVDLAIPFKFTIPLRFSDPYRARVREKILPYTKLLKSIYNMELRGRQVHELASGQESV